VLIVWLEAFKPLQKAGDVFGSGAGSGGHGSG
jgi:hypothetical protein